MGKQQIVKDASLLRLSKLEDVIERHLIGFIEVGKALTEIRDDKLYRLTHPTFEEWAKGRFNISRRRAYELMTATAVQDQLVRHGAQILPANERQSRALSSVPEGRRPAAWEIAVGLAGDDDLTEKHVRQGVREMNRRDRVQGLKDISDAAPAVVGFDGLKPAPVLLADPPWQYDSGTADPSRVIENKYPTMPLEDIMDLDVGSIATPDAVMFMWVPAPLLFSHGGPTLSAWGFSYRTGAVWDKQIIGPGYWFRGQHEHLLLGVRGNPPKPAPGDRRSSMIKSRRTQHSAKPSAVHQMIEAYYPDLFRIELFARAKRRGWQVWGNQSNKGSKQA